MPDEAARPPFLNTPALMESSQPRQRANWIWYLGGVFVLLMLLSSYAGEKAKPGPITQMFSSGLMLVLVGAMGLLTWHSVRTVRLEQRQLEAIEEMVQLRRWTDAARAVDDLLSRPARSPQTRALGLIYLAKVLARYGRYGDCVTLCDHLLETEMLDGEAAHTLRLDRAMALLHDDRLFDADKAITELRRAPSAAQSGGLPLVEIYRDVKTGHPDEAIGIYEAKLPVMRRQLGLRVADAHALAARAYDMIGRDADAQGAYEKATLLTVPEELARRYPEVAAITSKYQAAARPEVAA